MDLSGNGVLQEATRAAGPDLAANPHLIFLTTISKVQLCSFMKSIKKITFSILIQQSNLNKTKVYKGILLLPINSSEADALK